MADFDARQLDQLEDALERLESIDDPASLELSPALTERLAEYQDVLALCRDAYPLETPSDELLAEVIAEAHEVSRRPKLRDGLRPDAQDSSWPRFWERWRGTLIPGLALSATAVAVLWVLEPKRELDSAQDLLTDNGDADQRERDDNADRERSQPASEPSVDEARATPEADEPAPELGADDPKEIPGETPTEKVGHTEAPTRPSSKAKKSKSGASAPTPEPAPTPLTKDETWTSLERANAARRTGDCDRARSIYEDIIAASSDGLAVARAKAGIGLCFEQVRHDSKAATWFEAARSASPGIDAWINTQRDEQPMPGEKKQRNKKLASPELDSI
ncbi:hypothetical protein ENSA5_14690 [Enhygromyxa salina]|uniref:Tetratricopeptide repeat protein n=1 Tax=Enhygromyxa salina TaxID=215803 RepID=A0A2S9YEJ7_9BACT|nr:tetratricopeptide repeat protein [Enhygromyxa salina]PRQ03537.1 hypothetical protein ENSA5_14690 [Enhygromyxa salina]